VQFHAERNLTDQGKTRQSIMPIVLAGFTAFLDLYATQPLLPLLTRMFRATNFAVSLTVTAATTAVALAAPFVGALADRVGLRRTIVGSSFALAGLTALTPTARTLNQLVIWRFLQGLATPGIFAVAIAYIHEEWPASRAGRATAAYVSGTVVGGFTGRAMMGLIAGVADWRTGFAALALLNAIAALLLWQTLPIEKRQPRSDPRSRSGAGYVGAAASFGAFARHLRHKKLLATYAVGFCVLCSQVAMFTYVTFPLAAPPYGLSTAALGSLFVVYLVGAAATPLSGRWIDVYGHRIAFAVAVFLGIGGALLTLAPPLALVVVGLALFATSIFMAQASATSHVGAHVAEERALALGLYATFYYVGGSVGGALPAVVWERGGWPACVAFIIVVQLAMLATAWTLWQKRETLNFEL
jgi:predicted MFS family arabinose efflux permease